MKWLAFSNDIPEKWEKANILSDGALTTCSTSLSIRELWHNNVSSNSYVGTIFYVIPKVHNFVEIEK